MNRLFLALVLPASLLLSGCPDSSTGIDDQGASVSDFDWHMPDWVPLPVEPDYNPITEAKFQLGRYLFYDTDLSSDGSMSCESCHQQDKAFTDGVARPTGVTGMIHPRNSQSIANAAWVRTLTWGNPTLTDIEQQIVIPLFGIDPVEMGVNEANQDLVLSRLQRKTEYQTLFAEAFPDQSDPMYDEQAWQNIIHALASFVRGMTSFGSNYDLYTAGQSDALSTSAKRGMNLFNSEKLECFHCHEGYTLTASVRDRRRTPNIPAPFFNTGLYNIDGISAYPEPNTGKHELTGKTSDMGLFRPQSLRNIALTAPYNHDGSTATLREVILNYAAGGRNITSGPNTGDGRMNINKDPFIVSFTITEQEIEDVVAFLESLTDYEFINNPRYANPWQPPKDQDLTP
ncbi:methanobactin export MATE transporter MbnM [Alcanivorax sp. 24]|uniref:methanobactin export MATE transporter MbnM n=1 Tax=Alcanivorax sp. 24 TaxID=2545266 RepID=UPI00105FFF6B|nr:methanobactin export MATE transporter MbnM [Alcanivorax sp. 24]